ncbi:MAG: hypothetical protein WDW38_006802 [Sanguina aurantia]
MSSSHPPLLPPTCSSSIHFRSRSPMPASPSFPPNASILETVIHATRRAIVGNLALLHRIGILVSHRTLLRGASPFG